MLILKNRATICVKISLVGSAYAGLNACICCFLASPLTTARLDINNNNNKIEKWVGQHLYNNNGLEIHVWSLAIYTKLTYNNKPMLCLCSESNGPTTIKFKFLPIKSFSLSAN